MAEKNKSAETADDKRRADADHGEKLDKLLAGLDSVAEKLHGLHSRVDALESARKDADKSEEELKGELRPEKGAAATEEHIASDAGKMKVGVRVHKRDVDVFEGNRLIDTLHMPAEVDNRSSFKRWITNMARSRGWDLEEIPSPDFLGRHDEDGMCDANGENAAEGDMDPSPTDPNPVVADRGRRDGDEEDAERKRNEALAEEIEALKAKMPKDLDDDDFAELEKAQDRADSVARAFGERAIRPMSGESVIGYRRRVIAQYQGKSKKWGNVNLRTVTDPGLFAVIESEVMADALAASKSPTDLPKGRLREIIRPSGPGVLHETREFVGTTSWLRKSPSRRARLNTNVGR